ncbi:MAG: hypothetical protein LBC02_10570 [Planctomycetaceae bacterium]|nr:hypothetical protein [Planctomycetaceae bacterium]
MSQKSKIHRNYSVWQAGTKRSAVTASTCRKTSVHIRMFWQFHAVTALRSRLP